MACPSACKFPKEKLLKSEAPGNLGPGPGARGCDVLRSPDGKGDALTIRFTLSAPVCIPSFQSVHLTHVILTPVTCGRVVLSRSPMTPDLWAWLSLAAPGASLTSSRWFLCAGIVLESSHHPLNTRKTGYRKVGGVQVHIHQG